MLLRDIVLNMN